MMMANQAQIRGPWRLPPELVLHTASFLDQVEDVRQLAQAVASVPQACPMSLSVYQCGLPAPLKHYLTFLSPRVVYTRSLPPSTSELSSSHLRDMSLGHFDFSGTLENHEPFASPCHRQDPEHRPEEGTKTFLPSCAPPPALETLWKDVRHSPWAQHFCPADAEQVFGLWRQTHCQHRERALIWGWLTSLGERRRSIAKICLSSPWPHRLHIESLPNKSRAQAVSHPVMMADLAEVITIERIRCQSRPYGHEQVCMAGYIDEQLDLGRPTQPFSAMITLSAVWRELLFVLEPYWRDATPRAFLEAHAAGELVPHPRTESDAMYVDGVKEEANVSIFTRFHSDDDFAAISAIMARRARDRSRDAKPR